MSTKTPPQKSTVESTLDRAALIGVDGEGDRHYVGSPTVHDGHPVFVVGDDIQTYDLEGTPCADQPDAVAAWIDHVERKRGAWETIAYNQSIAELVADALEEI
ncbi:MAG: hypothetical protein ACOCY1_00665 [Halovenus sp.]